MLITIGELRRFIVESLNNDFATMNRGIFTGRNPMSPEQVDREAIGSLADPTNDEDVNDYLPAHLREPLEDKVDCYGPVPPTRNQQFVIEDPYVTDAYPMRFR
jgi:hypothetical protein